MMQPFSRTESKLHGGDYDKTAIETSLINLTE